jgi:hypothetical protein
MHALGFCFKACGIASRRRRANFPTTGRDNLAARDSVHDVKAYRIGIPGQLLFAAG